MSTSFWQATRKWVSLAKIRSHAEVLGFRIEEIKSDEPEHLVPVRIVDDEGNWVYCFGYGPGRPSFYRNAGCRGADIVLKKLCDYFGIGIRDDGGHRIDEWDLENLKAYSRALERCFARTEANGGRYVR